MLEGGRCVKHTNSLTSFPQAWMWWLWDGVDDLPFYNLSAVFKSYLDDGRMIMKGFQTWSPFRHGKISASSGA